MTARRVRALLMGGQACVFYGAAEFSRDTDLLVIPDPENLERLQAALDELRAECIAVPPFSAEYLRRGHAVHFRCHHLSSVESALEQEEHAERERDRRYWEPLKAELQELRHAAPRRHTSR